MKSEKNDQSLSQNLMFPEFNVPMLALLLALPVLPHFLNDIYIIYLNEP